MRTLASDLENSVQDMQRFVNDLRTAPETLSPEVIDAVRVFLSKLPVLHWPMDVKITMSEIQLRWGVEIGYADISFGDKVVWHFSMTTSSSSTDAIKTYGETSIDRWKRNVGVNFVADAIDYMYSVNAGE
jgi:hypothetical protein